MEKKKAILVWSDGINMHSHTFTGTDDMSAFEEAQKQMYKEYDDRSNEIAPDEECGAYKGMDSCLYLVDGQDNCVWNIYEV